MDAIDAVITWVDGYDPAHKRKLHDFCTQQGVNQTNVVEPTRIQQCNEIHYCLHALRRFAPWIRTIYIVTNQQIPPTVTALQGTQFGDKLTIIDQNDLLRDCGSTLPVFNSISVEWVIWKIKGLSNHFLYLNDDFFILRDVTPNDFFRHNRSVLRGSWKVRSDKKWLYQLKKHLCAWMGRPEPTLKTNPHRAWQEHSALLAGWKNRFFLLPHAPFPLIKETFTTHIAQETAQFEDNIRYPFRDPKQVSSIPLMTHLDIKHKRAVFESKNPIIMVNGETHSFKKIKSRLHRAKNNPNTLFVCLQSIDQAPPDTQHYMINWLKKCIEE